MVITEPTVATARLLALGSNLNVHPRNMPPMVNKDLTEVTNIWKSLYKNCRVHNNVKEDHRSYRCNFCSCGKKAWKQFRLVWEFSLSFCNCKSCIYNCDDLFSNKDLTPFIQSLSWLPQTQVSESKTLLAGWRFIDLSIQVTRENNLVA